MPRRPRWTRYAVGALGAALMGIAAVTLAARRLLPHGTTGQGILALDTSYSLHLIRDRGLETAVTALDLDGFFDHVWFVHPLVGASPEHPEGTGTGPCEATDLTPDHTVVEGRIARTERLESFPLLNFALAQIDLLRTLDKILATGRVSIIRAGDPHYKGLIGWFLARIHRMPFAIRIGGNYDEAYEITGESANPRLIPSRGLEKRIERFILRRADLVVGANENNLQFAVENGADRTSTAVFRYGNLLHPIHFEEPKRRGDQGEIRSELGLEDEPLLVYIGRLEPIKRPGDIIEAMALIVEEHADAMVILVGDGTLREELETLARQMGVAENLRFVGYKDQAWIGRLLATSTAGISPHMGRALAEVALGALPVVAYNRDWQSELVEPGVTGYLAPQGDIRGLADGACRLLEDPAGAARMGRTARERALELMDPDRLADHERRTYEALLEGGP